MLNACRFDWIVPMAAGLLAVAFLAWQYVRAGKTVRIRLGELHVSGWIGVALLLAAVGTAVPAFAQEECRYPPAACPPAIGGNGYPCANQYAECDPWNAVYGNCLTRAGTMPWHSPCECFCVAVKDQTSAELEAAAARP